MNTQLFFLVAGLVLALGLLGVVAENAMMTSQSAFAVGGPKGEKNYGQ